MKKSTMYLALAAVGLLAFANNVFANPGPPTVPDGGCSLLLLGISAVGLAVGRKFLR